ncbi:hypothetical protein MSG28_009179 [Choristoneura fumiferana]|uniref:Uncharacterized protein n=1 Tax=Choristoneura fumiferana TaxID=7141 RepID=A0ACC0KX59_CHOFU|nr:hypothetical protein MSG28_009179 [Choristoneura fumiferana]
MVKCELDSYIKGSKARCGVVRDEPARAQTTCTNAPCSYLRYSAYLSKIYPEAGRNGGRTMEFPVSSQDRLRWKEFINDLKFGPGFWGLINPQWSMCNKGRRQSPVNIEPEKLLFDPWLRDIQFDKHKVSGVLQNTGQSLVFRVEKDSKHQVNISGGPLSYRYQFEEIYFHYGLEDNRGSEHQIDHHTFPGEQLANEQAGHLMIQLYGFNKELYHNMSEAQHKSQGIVGISLMVQIGEPTNKELRLITSAFSKVTYRGSSFPIKHLPLSSLLPNTQQYLTYEGSTTHPGCWETAVWIIFNKPIYISKQEMYALRRLMQGSEQSPKAPLGNNARPSQPLHHRTVRTNINFNKQGSQVTASVPAASSVCGEGKHREETCTNLRSNSMVCVKFPIRTGAWELWPKPSCSERRPVPSSGTYKGWDDDDDDEINSNCPDMYRNMHYTATQWPREHNLRYRSADDLAMLQPN